MYTSWLKQAVFLPEPKNYFKLESSYTITPGDVFAGYVLKLKI